MPHDRQHDANTAPANMDACAICGGDLWADGLEPARDGDDWICGDCDQGRNFTALDT
ncbi:MAG TPA: hypothetical protein VM253_09490 [Candidatus Limnocylindrales bacterium]|nr:hypothetical protein [Candidatus Limnocylindrales bacterium]